MRGDDLGSVTDKFPGLLFLNRVRLSLLNASLKISFSVSYDCDVCVCVLEAYSDEPN